MLRSSARTSRSSPVPRCDGVGVMIDCGLNRSPQRWASDQLWSRATSARCPRPRYGDSSALAELGQWLTPTVFLQP